MTLNRPSSICVASGRSRFFDSLACKWRFEAGPEASSALVSFSLTFTVHNAPMQSAVVHRFFEEVAHRQVSAFEARCHVIYPRTGRPAAPGAPGAPGAISAVS